ncbi:hypothetical protein [Rivibacter subsaxonicus]|uniref:Uncharacterized protein n=1 Tax=Rivibacter subsaxonicus TaxID=457575 RepID=A0A4Q7W0K0_9BURK|nr:hypothetical protein [Rivibacter subsaxonicus]RZU02345.1 hypothetical protein EV670_0368 [Rivibacter subsaxonicus]
MRRAKSRRDAPVKVWPVPIALGLITAVGLVAALLGDGWLNMLSWLALALPLVVIAVFWRRGARGRDPGPVTNSRIKFPDNVR